MTVFQQVKKIYLDRKVEHSAQVNNLLKKLPNLPVEVVEEVKDIQQEIRLASDPVAEGKQLIFLTEQKSFIRPCPCTSGCFGCGYWTLDLDLNCPFDCSYCILQKYLEGQPITLATNREDLRKELEQFFARERTEVIRIGTGELADSLALEELTGNAIFLADIFRNRPGYLLELKSKAASIQTLMSITSVPNLILSWSLNPESVIRSEEKGTASLEERFQSALAAAKQGYRLGFHFDPIIHYPGWEEDYQSVVLRLFKLIPEEAISWISLGTLRFPPDLPLVARRRFPKSSIYEHEFVRSWDGKFRYPRPLRLRMYESIVEMISQFGSDKKIYLCMESPEVWEVITRKIKKGRHLNTFPFPWEN